MTTKNPRLLVEEFLSGKEKEVVHEVLILGKGLRRDALLLQMRKRLREHPKAAESFSNLVGKAIAAELK